jgi:hypothetical protein
MIPTIPDQRKWATSLNDENGPLFPYSKVPLPRSHPLLIALSLAKGRNPDKK